MSFPYRFPEDDPIDDGPVDRSTYSGAPDECSLHWPTKYDANGDCPKCLEQAAAEEQWAAAERAANEEERAANAAMERMFRPFFSPRPYYGEKE